MNFAPALSPVRTSCVRSPPSCPRSRRGTAAVRASFNRAIPASIKTAGRWTSGCVASVVSSAATRRSSDFMASSEEMSYRSELELACEAVKLASKLCQKVQLGLLDAEKQDKEDDSPVTVADYGAQAVVAWVLQKASAGADISMVAEEDSAELKRKENAGMLARITELVNGVVGEQLSSDDVIQLIDLGGSQGGPHGRHWVLDPIDGTRGFVGGRQYAVCLGLIDEGQVVVGALGCPNMPEAPLTDADGTDAAKSNIGTPGYGVCFCAIRGAGAFAGSLTDNGVPQNRIFIQDSADFSKMRFMESYESRHSAHGVTGALAEKAGINLPPLRLDSQCKYGALSRGDAAIFIRFPPPSYREKIWDHAAGTVIAKEAGAMVTDAGGEELDFSRGRWLDLDRGIIVAPPTLHAKLLEAARE